MTGFIIFLLDFYVFEIFKDIKIYGFDLKTEHHINFYEIIALINLEEITHYRV